MIAAGVAVQRPRDARLLAIDRRGGISHLPRSEFIRLLRPGDLVIANDAATLPASLKGRHLPSGQRIEVRLAGRESIAGIRRFSAILFGEGDFRMRTEDRPLPPAMQSGDRLELGALQAVVVRVRRPPRWIELRFEGSAAEIWEGLARHGRPIQYSHLQMPLAIWDTWTAIAGPPVAFEAPSAGFILDWSLLAAMRRRNIHFTTVTHAAGISSTGDPDLDALLPFDEPYRISPSAARLIASAQRIIAIGTSVVRALEHSAALFDGIVPPGERVATQRIGATTRLRIVNAILSGTHEPGTSHYELLRAFTDDATLARSAGELEASAYRTHEFGDSVFLEASGVRENDGEDDRNHSHYREPGRQPVAPQPVGYCMPSPLAG